MALAAGIRERDERMRWWREARFGMFIHWGVYAVPAGFFKGEEVKGIGEWIMLRARIPVAEYREYAKAFNPVKYDPREWARLAREAGMKYVVITSKHHDGFALYDTEVSDWNVVDATPYGKDLLAPLAEAVRAEGLKFGLYYSQAQDWVHPGGAKWNFEEGDGWDEAHKGDFDAYIDQIAVPQVREILTRFEPDVLWWDTPRWMTPERADKFRPLLSLCPEIIVNNRLLHGDPGDFSTPEQYVPPTGLDYDWETCMTMNNTWGYKSADHDWKSVETLIRHLVDIASKGGNFLLNVGPTAEGEIPKPSVERLKAIGRWMDVNGESIYATTASPVHRPEWGRVTTKAGDKESTLYLHVFDWPADGRIVVPVANEALGAYLLADKGRRCPVQRGEDGLIVELVGGAPDPVDSVVVLKIAGRPVALPHFVRPGKDGVVRLTAFDGSVHGESVRVESKRAELCIGSWTNPGDWAGWLCKGLAPGTYSVRIEAAAAGEARLRVTVGDAQVESVLPTAQDLWSFGSVEAGTVQVGSSGELRVEARPDPSRWSDVKMREITLAPV